MKIDTKKVASPAGEITLVTLTNVHGSSVTLSSLGAGIVGITVPDRDGNMADVVLGYANPADYLADGPCAGKVPGRYANRIGAGRFTIDGKTYELAINNGPNALHGGPTGFANRIWDVEAAGNHVKFTYTAADGEEGYPGRLTATAIYYWDNNNELTLNLKAVTDKKTVVNLTNHAYFNLAGHDAGNALDQQLQIYASKFLDVDANLLPTGRILPVKDTPMDFTSPKAIGRDMLSNLDFPALKAGKGYDSCWVIDGWRKHQLSPVARLMSPSTGRVLEVSTTQPGVQIYAGCWLEGCPTSKSGTQYHDYDGIAIECQGFPDAPNHRNFPSQILGPGEEYDQTIVFHFTTQK